MSDGWLPTISTAISLDEARWLRQHARDKFVVEVGSWHGFSACLFATVAAQVVSIDPHQGDRWHLKPEDETWLSLEPFLGNLVREGALGKVIPVIGRSEVVLPMLREDWFHLAFIDGDHSYEAVASDAMLVESLIVPGGLIVFHDYEEFGVGDAVNDVFGSRVKRGPGSLAYVEVERA